MATRQKRKLFIVIPARESRDIDLTVRSILEQQAPSDVAMRIVVVIGNGDTTPEFLETTDPRVEFLEVFIPPEFIRDAQYKRHQGTLYALKQGAELIGYADSKGAWETGSLASVFELAETYASKVIAGISPDWPEKRHTFMSIVHDSALVGELPEFPEVGWLTLANFGKSESLPVTTALVMSAEVAFSIIDDFAVNFSKVAMTYDDYVLSWLICKEGFDILLTNRFVAYHRHRNDLPGYQKQISRSGQSAAHMLKQYPECPFGHRRLKQVVGIWSMTAMVLLMSLCFFLVIGVSGIVPFLLFGLATYSLLGIANVAKARDIRGFIIPVISILLIYTFAWHFAKTLIRPSKPESYLQVQ